MNQPIVPQAFPCPPNPFRDVFWSNSFVAIIDRCIKGYSDRGLIPPPCFALIFSFVEYICRYEEQQRQTPCQQPECAVFPQCDRSLGIAKQPEALRLSESHIRLNKPIRVLFASESWDSVATVGRAMRADSLRDEHHGTNIAGA